MDWLSRCLDKPQEELRTLLSESLGQCASSRSWVLVRAGLSKATNTSSVPELIELSDWTLNDILELYQSFRRDEVIFSDPLRNGHLQTSSAPLLPMQQSYVIGRQDATLGPCQIYTEAGPRKASTPPIWRLSSPSENSAERTAFGSIRD